MKNQIVPLTLSTLLGIGVALGASSPAQTPAAGQQQDQAEQDHQHRPDPARQVKFLTRRLNLDADQQTEVLSVLNDRAQQTEAIRSDSSLSTEDRHAKMHAIRQDTDARIEAVLTPEQKQTYEQMQQQSRERARQRHQNTEPPQN